MKNFTIQAWIWSSHLIRKVSTSSDNVCNIEITILIEVPVGISISGYKTSRSNADTSKIRLDGVVKPISFLGLFICYIQIGGLEPVCETASVQSSSFSDSYNYQVIITQSGDNITQEYPIKIDFNGGKSFSFSLDSYYSFFDEKDLPTTHF
ncbi:hypothetical protein ACTA71_000274 [Dictyostelium dimigraforme]